MSLKKSIFPHKLSIITLIFFVLYFVVPTSSILGKQRSSKKVTKIKKAAIGHVNDMSEELSQIAGKIWEFAETAMEEYKSSKLLGDFFEKQGFEVKFGIGGVPVAFTATYGEGHPVIGILGEFDALPGLSQKAGFTIKEAIKSGEPGHGCGHNLFGVASAGAAVAVKKIMQQYKFNGTIKFFGCPAEETVEGKTYMAKAGAFSGLDVCLDWHPSDENEVNLNTSNALNNFEVTFHGKTSHAAGDPWNGRSALDAVELMNIGVNYLREHVPTTVRIHYVIKDGGKAPNVVPDYAKVWYFVRGKDRKEVEEIYARVLKIAEGAALMTETTHEVYVITGVYNYIKNKVVASVLHNNLTMVGAPPFTPEEQEFAKKLQHSFDKEEKGLSTVIKPFTEPESYSGGGSTDAADVSWLVPTASLNVACCPLKIPGHSWGIVTCAGSSLGFKGMHTAAKVLAASAIDLFLKPKLILDAQKEFKEKTKDFVYKCAIPKDQKPRLKKKRDF